LGVVGWQAGYDLYGFEADADDLGDEADDVLGVVEVDAVLVDDPFEGAAVAEAG